VQKAERPMVPAAVRRESIEEALQKRKRRRAVSGERERGGCAPARQRWVQRQTDQVRVAVEAQEDVAPRRPMAVRWDQVDVAEDREV